MQSENECKYGYVEKLELISKHFNVQRISK